MAKTTRKQYYSTMRSFRVLGLANKAYSSYTTRYTDNDVSGRKYEIEHIGKGHTITRIEYNLHATLFPLTYILITSERKNGTRTYVLNARGRNGMTFFKSCEVHSINIMYWHLASFIVCVLDNENGTDTIPMLSRGK